ncbi:hypothetical protein TNCV_3263691, partial [Trichonephila clavipes]
MFSNRDEGGGEAECCSTQCCYISLSSIIIFDNNKLDSSWLAWAINPPTDLGRVDEEIASPC